MSEIEIKTILSKKNSTKLYDVERRLILLALIKSDFKTSEAHKLNAPNMLLSSYRTLVSRHFKINQVKKVYKKLQKNLVK